MFRFNFWEKNVRKEESKFFSATKKANKTLLQKQVDFLDVRILQYFVSTFIAL